MSKLLNWQADFITEINNMTLLQLWAEYISDYGEPDDYDGCFTNRGAWYCTTAENRIENLIKEIVSDT